MVCFTNIHNNMSHVDSGAARRRFSPYNGPKNNISLADLERTPENWQFNGNSSRYSLIVRPSISNRRAISKS